MDRLRATTLRVAVAELRVEWYGQLRRLGIERIDMVTIKPFGSGIVQESSCRVGPLGNGRADQPEAEARRCA